MLAHQDPTQARVNPRATRVALVPTQEEARGYVTFAAQGHILGMVRDPAHHVARGPILEVDKRLARRVAREATQVADKHHVRCVDQELTVLVLEQQAAARVLRVALGPTTQIVVLRLSALVS